MDLISVIVPVYKVEEYLDRCVQSIVDQTYRNLEIILVDDGSPDNCGCLCDAWAEKDSRIKVIHKENGGGAQARNIGLDCAKGEYIGFVDSDDFIHPEMYRYLHEMIQKTQSDVAECGYYLTEDDIFLQEEVEEEVHVFNTEEALKENIRDHICRQLMWNKLYKRETVGGTRMVEGKSIDDEFFTYRVLARANSIAVGKQVMYAYRQQQESIMHQKYSIKWLAAIEAKCCRYKLIQEKFPRLVHECAINLAFSCLYHGQLALIHLKEPEKQQALEQLKNIFGKTPLELKGLSVTHKCWLVLAKCSFEICCKARNKLSIGL